MLCPSKKNQVKFISMKLIILFLSKEICIVCIFLIDFSECTKTFTFELKSKKFPGGGVPPVPPDPPTGVSEGYSAPVVPQYCFGSSNAPGNDTRNNRFDLVI